MRWFREHPKITISLVILLILLILFYVSLLSVGKNNILGRTLGVAVVEIQKPFVFVGNGINHKMTSFFTANKVEKENEDLKSKISDLENELSREKLKKSELKELSQLSKAFDDDKSIDDYEPVAAEIISYDGSNIFNVFTVDAGSDSGIEVNDAVMNDQGLIGRVTSVGKNWSKIIAVIDESNKVGFQLGKDLKYRGVCEGNGKENLTGYLFDEKAPVKENDEIVTSGIGGVYPPGLNIGKVTKVDRSQDSPLKLVTIEPAVSFNSIKKVAVITGDVES